MGALPKRKISRSRQKKRRGVIRIKAPTLVVCPNCGQKKRPHQTCGGCGDYKGERVVIKKEKKTKAKTKS